MIFNAFTVIYFIKCISVPVLMLADYFLTLYTKKLSMEQSKEVGDSAFELNPTQQEAVNSLKWFNSKHLITVLLATLVTLGIAFVAVFVNHTYGYMLFDWFLGMLVGTFGSVVSQHVSNILLLREFKSNSELAKYNVKPEAPHLYTLSSFRVVQDIVLLTIALLLVPNVFLFGMICGLIIVMQKYKQWKTKALKVVG